MAATQKGSRIVFMGLKIRTTDEFVRIALAGKGCVFFRVARPFSDRDPCRLCWTRTSIALWGGTGGVG